MRRTGLLRTERRGREMNLRRNYSLDVSLILITVYTFYRVLITMYLLMYTYHYAYKY